MEFHAVRRYRRCEPATLGTAGSSNLEEIAKIGGKADLDPKMSGGISVIAKTEALIADGLPKKFGSLDCDRVARQRNDAVLMNIRVGKSNRERHIVVLDDRAQQQGPFPLEAEIVPG